ncbi:MAG: 3-deoxy-manno-octulosonate cytidylyltransferase [Candidatus Marinimicrobia bacterium]|jgi:3-deoxy-manno-octulosonate cytidylyltransferase (CMP-KDO synthetase)|nr:3-deoxy-manno-octulosonate cytidylyltransferase [Candidatus Neomarinimicrobiota bacterium]MDP6835801.1 3-deoxy-manno-octulosonate cytidylyltransferase [Candidatus Neomarinimicrobiota bacterium]|tara:strand:+ start:6871 stop:7584 length:714 start_codon:yes stop_codon:yes gene_type:complete
MKIEGVIPARFDSTRFPGKVLIPIDGTPMVARVYAQSIKSSRLESVTVATDDNRVREVMETLAIPVTMTSSDHSNGSERVAEVAQSGNADVYVNIQGDEPFIDPRVIDELLAPFTADTPPRMGTVASTQLSDEDWTDPDVVKVRVSAIDTAEDFFRRPDGVEREQCYKHLGLYAYRRDILIRLAQMDASPRETARSLEQMRALDNGIPIRVVLTDYNSLSIDTPADLKIIGQEEAIG